MAATLPLRLVLHFDLNGTVVLSDTVKKKTDEQMLIAALAENTISSWAGGGKPLSFKKYVHEILLPGDKSQPALKAKREEQVEQFLIWLKEHQRPELPQVLENLQKIKDKYRNPQTGRLEFKVFPSFYRLVERLKRMQIPFKVIFRTFGTDLPNVVKEVEEHPAGFKVARYGKIQENCLQIGEHVVQKIEDIFKEFTTSGEHLAVQDDWKYWNRGGEKGVCGKLFPFEETEVLSLFFDDNATGEELDIIQPRTLSGEYVPAGKLLGHRVFAVDTLQAMLDDEYFSRLVLPLVQGCQKASAALDQLLKQTA